MTTTGTTNWQDRSEEAVQILILLAIGAMAGAASFTHVHDWTMDNSPADTDDWFGWANAVVSELTPLASGLEVRRRRRRNPDAPIGFPLAVLIGSACFSLAAQVSQAEASASGWILAALPAIGFLVLAKMVLSRPAAPATPEPVEHPSAAPAASTLDTPTPVDVVPEPIAPTSLVPVVRPEVPQHLLSSARFAVVNHEQTTGNPITPGELAARMSLPHDTAVSVLTALGEPITPARVNGVPVLSGETRP